MGRLESFWRDCHVDFLTYQGLRWNWGSTRLRVAATFEAVYDSTGPALEGNAEANESYSGTIHRNRARLQ